MSVVGTGLPFQHEFWRPSNLVKNLRTPDDRKDLPEELLNSRHWRSDVNASKPWPW